MSEPAQKKVAMSSLDQLKEFTTVVADSGDINGERNFTGVELLASGWGNNLLHSEKYVKSPFVLYLE